MATKKQSKVNAMGDKAKPNPDDRATVPPEATNYEHPKPAGALECVPGAGVVDRGDDVSTHPGGPGSCAPGAKTTAPNAQRPGTTEGRAASAARRGAKGGLDEIEAPSAEGQTAYAPPTGGTGAPFPGSSGIRATSDPNFTAQRAGEEGTPSQAALDEQAASLGKKHLE